MPIVAVAVAVAGVAAQWVVAVHAGLTEHFLAFAGVAAALIGYRRLTRG